jgi:hypothetical protein
MKTCTKCKVEKELHEFSKDKQKKDGLTLHCKVCVKNNYELNKEKILARKKQYVIDNQEKILKYNKEYNKLNRDKISSYNKLYNEKNKDKKSEYNKIYQLRYSIIQKLKSNIRTLIRMSFKRGKGNLKKESKTEQILGCTINEFINHIESQLKEGMTIENHGDWHLDHIIPLAKAKTEEEVIKLNHYTNFQPLWAAENLSKGSKII